MTALNTTEYAQIRRFMVPLTVEQYHQMIEDGILEEGAPIELIDGFLVRKDRSAKGEDPMTIEDDHAWVVDQLAELTLAVKKAGGKLRTQQPIVLEAGNEPEPDGSIVFGDAITLRRQPRAKQVSCVIEVADSSVEFDRTTKQRIYADNDLPQYLIINLADKAIEEYLDPKPGTGRYAVMNTYRAGQRLTLRVGAHMLEVAVADLLP